MGDWARIHQRFGKNSNEVTKRGNLTNGDYKKMANLGENGKFRQKWRVQEFGQIQIDDKKGNLNNENFIKMTNLAKIYKSLAKM